MTLILNNHYNFCIWSPTIEKHPREGRRNFSVELFQTPETEEQQKRKLRAHKSQTPLRTTACNTAVENSNGHFLFKKSSRHRSISYECVILSLDPSSAFLCHISQIRTAFSGKALVDYFSSASPSPYPPTRLFYFWTYLATKIMLPSLILSSASYSCSDSRSTVQNNVASYPFPTAIKVVPMAFSFIFSQIHSSVFPATFLLSNGHLDLDDQTICFCCSHINP